MTDPEQKPQACAYTSTGDGKAPCPYNATATMTLTHTGEVRRVCSRHASALQNYGPPASYRYDR